MNELRVSVAQKEMHQ